MRRDYPFTPGVVGNWWNVYDRHDLVQRLGGRIPGFGGRTNPAAHNIRVSSRLGPISTHSGLHDNYAARTQWEMTIRFFNLQNGWQEENPNLPKPAGRYLWPF